MNTQYAKVLGEALVSMALARPRFTDGAHQVVDELEALDISQVDESERQPWSPAYKNRVMEIIDRHMKSK